MADTPLSRIEQIVIDSLSAPFSAEYRPTPLAEKPVKGCDLPPKISSKLSLPDLPVVKDRLDCNLNFIPTPIIVPPFIPPIDNFNCPDGYSFDSQYDSATGETLKQQAPSGGQVALTINDPNTIEHFDLDPVILPDLYIYVAQNHNGESISGNYLYDIVLGATYKVEIANYDPVAHKGKGVDYFDSQGVATTFEHNQLFIGVTGHAQAQTNPAALNADVTIYEVQHQRLTGYDKNAPYKSLYVKNEFVRLPVDKIIHKFELHRLVFSSDPLKDTAGIIDFMQKPCGGHIFGEINFSIANIDLACKGAIGGDNFVKTDTAKVTITNYLSRTIAGNGTPNTDETKSELALTTDHSSQCSYIIGIGGAAMDIPDVEIILDNLAFKKTAGTNKVTYSMTKSQLSGIVSGTGGGCVGCCRWS